MVDLLRRLNEDPSSTASCSQLPLPAGLDDQSATIEIDPAKDVDGLHPTNLGMIVLDRPVFAPCTPSGCLRILEHYDVPLRGASVVVVGTFVPGRAAPRLAPGGARGADATVTIAHSRTEDLPGVTRRADILVVAVGRPEMVTGRYVREGAVVIDVGINRTESGSLVET